MARKSTRRQPPRQRRGARHRRRRGEHWRAPRIQVSTDYVVRRGRARAPTSSPTPSVPRAPTGARSSPARSPCARTRRAMPSSAPPGCSERAARTSSTPCAVWRRARRGHRRRRPSRLPDLHRPSRRGTGRGRRAPGLTGTFHVAGGGQLLLVRSRGGDVRPPRAPRSRSTGHAAPISTARAPRPTFSGPVHGARRRPPPARLARGPRRAPRSASGGPMRLPRSVVVPGSSARNFARIRANENGDDVVVLDKLTYAGRRENLADVDHDVRSRRDRGRGRGDRAALDRRRRDRQLRRRDARRPLDRRARRLRAHARARDPRRCSRPPAPPASATCRSPPTRSTARSTRGPSPRSRRSPRPRPTPRPRPAPTCSSPPTSTPTGWRR